MNDEELRAFASDWPDIWQQPELWRAVVNGPRCSIDRGAVISGLLRNLIFPPTPVEILYGLMDDGAFNAVAALLEDSRFMDTVGNALTGREPSPDLDLEQRRLLAHGEILGKIDLLLERSRDANGSLSLSDSPLQDAVYWSERDLREARRELHKAEELVEQEEATCVANLRRQLQMSSLNSVDDHANDDWRTAIERSLVRRRLAVAEMLLAAGPDRSRGSTNVDLPAPLEDAGLANYEPATVCAWILDERPAPPEHARRWSAALSVSTTHVFVRAVRRLCVADDINESDVRNIAISIEHMLGVIKEGEKHVERVGDCYRTAIRGLYDEACPIFDSVDVPLYIEPPNTRWQSGIHWSIPPAVMLQLDGDNRSIGSCAHLTPMDLLRCLVRPADFRFNLLRILCSRIPRRQLLPARSNSPANWMALCRSDHQEMLLARSQHGPQLVFGAVGCGKTVFLNAITSALQREGWQCSYVTDHSPLQFERDPFDSQASPRSALVIDNGHLITAVELEQLFQRANAAGSRVRLIVCGNPVLRERAPMSVMARGAHYRLPLLSFPTLRSFAERVLDVSGYAPSPELLDRIAFYAAGRPAILYALLRSLFLELEEGFVPPGAPISIERLETACYGREFRQAARAMLLSPVESDAVANMVFAALLIEIDGRRNSTARREGITEWLSAESIELSCQDLDAALEYLGDLEVIDKDSATSTVTLSRSSGYVLLSLLPDDPDQYFSEAKARFTTQRARLRASLR